MNIEKINQFRLVDIFCVSALNFEIYKLKSTQANHAGIIHYNVNILFLQKVNLIIEMDFPQSSLKMSLTQYSL